MEDAARFKRSCFERVVLLLRRGTRFARRGFARRGDGGGKLMLAGVPPSADELIADDERFMRMALDRARAAGEAGEVPIGAVVVRQGQVIAQGDNRRERDCDPSGHAEFLAILQAARELGRWRLSDCTVYVTLEPCIMCAGLMHQARIGRCVYGAHDPKAGALGSLYSVYDDVRLNHRFCVESGVLEGECVRLLREFFEARRTGRQERESDKCS